MNVTITFPPRPEPPPIDPPANIRTLKPWAYDAQMIADNYSVTKRLINGEPIGQFSLINLYLEDATGKWLNDWSANQLSVNLSHDDMLRIAALQRPDAYSLEAKMNWLTWGGVDSWGAPMRIPGGGHWSTADRVQMISCAWAGEQVEIIGNATKTISFNGKSETVSMSQIRTFNPATDWGKTNATHPHLVPKVTAVNNRDGVIKPKGIIYVPLITRGARAWVLDRWLR